MGRLTSTIILIVALAGLGGYIYFVDSKRPAPGSTARDKVFTVEADTIEEITLKNGGESTTLKKVDGTWKITAPMQVDADQTEASSLTSNIASLEVSRVVDENAANLSEYGLATPAIELSYKAVGGASGQVYLGDKTATQSDMYAVKPGEKKVFVVPAFQESTFAKKSFDLRDKKILNFERDKVDSLEISVAAAASKDAKPAAAPATIQLARSGSDWTVKQPLQARADYSAVEGLLTKLASGNMTKLVEASTADPAVLAKYGLDKPAATITLGAGSTRATLALGKEEEGVAYARDLTRPMVFAVDPTFATDLKKPADDYRDKDLFEFRNFNAARVRIVRGADAYEFQKATGTGANATDKWQKVGAGGAATDVDSATMDDLLSKLTAMRAQSYAATLDKTGLDKPALVVAVSYDQGKFERVRFGSVNADAFATREGEGGVAKLDARAFDDLSAALTAIVAPPPAAAPAGNASPASPSANASPK
jgi:hypothetical protein